ncbi:MAG: TIGR04211 family SH3 domain-containing protein [Syntrophales bacterium]|nr:TIGR04211 family SH3 domain-containing protein [Syntrophales bacterium]
MKKIVVVKAMIIIFYFAVFSVHAAVYVSDNLEAPLRTGPGTDYKIVGMLKSGQLVKILSEKDGWSNVQLSGEGDGKDGWILTRYLMRREPWAAHVKRLETENAELRKTVVPMEKDLGETKTRNADLSEALENKAKELESIKQKYASLKKDSSGFLELREEFEKTKSQLKNIEGEFATTVEENKLLRNSQRNKWFLTGALVLLFGLIIGLIMGKREKKRSSRLY